MKAAETGLASDRCNRFLGVRDMGATATLRWSGRGGGEVARDNSLTTQNAILVYDVITTSALDDESTVLLAAGLPITRQSHPTNLYLRCSSRQARKMSPLHWEVTCSYEMIGKNGNPLNAPPQIEWTTSTTEEEIDEDIEGRPICTVVGEPFDPPIRSPRSDLVLRVTRNLPTFDPSVIRFYTDTVNADTILGQPPGTARIKHLSALSVTDDDFVYWRASIEIHFRRGAPRTTDERAWWTRVRAQGFFVKVPLPVGIGLPGALVIKRATDDTGAPVTKPVLHYSVATGNKQPGERIPVDPNDPWPLAQWYEFQHLESRPFGPLGFF